MANKWGNNGNRYGLYFLGLQNHCRWWLQPWNWKTFAPFRKAMTNLGSILKSRGITLQPKVCLVKAVVFPVVMYGCESWTMKKAECQRIDAFEVWCWRRLLRVPWIAGKSNQSILKEISPGCSLEELMVRLKLQCFGHLMRELTHFKRSWCWEGLGAGGEGDNRGWDGWMASPTRWTWVWVNSWSWWWTGRPGVLQFVGSQRVGHDWATELNMIQQFQQLGIYLKKTESLIWKDTCTAMFTAALSPQPRYRSHLSTHQQMSG